MDRIADGYVGLDVVKEALVVGHEYEAAAPVPQAVDPVCNDLQLSSINSWGRLG